MLAHIRSLCVPEASALAPAASITVRSTSFRTSFSVSLFASVPNGGISQCPSGTLIPDSACAPRPAASDQDSPAATSPSTTNHAPGIAAAVSLLLAIMSSGSPRPSARLQTKHWAACLVGSDGSPMLHELHISTPRRLGSISLTAFTSSTPFAGSIRSGLCGATARSSVLSIALACVVPPSVVLSQNAFHCSAQVCMYSALSSSALTALNAYPTRGSLYELISFFCTRLRFAVSVAWPSSLRKRAGRPRASWAPSWSSPSSGAPSGGAPSSSAPSPRARPVIIVASSARATPSAAVPGSGRPQSFQPCRILIAGIPGS